MTEINLFSLIIMDCFLGFSFHLIFSSFTPLGMYSDILISQSYLIHDLKVITVKFKDCKTAFFKISLLKFFMTSFFGCTLGIWMFPARDWTRTTVVTQSTAVTMLIFNLLCHSRTPPWHFFLIATPSAYGRSWAREWIWATAVNCATVVATPNLVTYCAGSGIEPMSPQWPEPM